jgi:D-sedoheptulose 7-phosphate isomerase
VNLFKKNLIEHLELMSKLSLIENQVYEAIDVLTNSVRNGGKIIFCGNGGSAADSQHLAAEFTGRFIKDREPIAAISLTTDTSALTCISNDYDFTHVYSRQLLAIGKEGDCLITISTSGNSTNLIRAVEIAKANKIVTIGLLGKTGGPLLNICDYSILVPHDITARIQEAHIFIGHTICGAIEINLGLV